MKLKNILPFVSILFALFSCSLEEDKIIYDNIESSVNDQNKDAFVNVSFALTADEASTKTAGSEPGGTEAGIANEKTITTCSVIISHGDKVVVVGDNITLIDGITTTSYLLEAKAGYTITVVANSTVAFTDCATLSAVEEKIQQVSTFSASTLVKVGSFEIQNLGTTYETPDLAREKENTKTFTVPVSQLAARIEFAGFNLTKIDGFNEAIKVKSVTVENLNYKVYTKTTGNFVDTGINTAESSLGSNLDVITDDGDSKGNLADGAVSAYTFPNTLTTTKPVKMTVVFQVGEQTEVTKYFVINRPTETGYTNTSGHEYVQSNYIYRVKIAATVENGTVGYELVCYTLDWKYNKIDIDLDDLP